MTYIEETEYITLPRKDCLKKEDVLNWKKAKRVIIPEGVREIGDFAFEDFEDLVEIVLPETLEEIGMQAFRNCKSLQKIDIPVNCSLAQYYYGGVAFAGCTALNTIALGNNYKVREDGTCKIICNIVALAEELKNNNATIIIRYETEKELRQTVNELTKKKDNYSLNPIGDTRPEKLGTPIILNGPRMNKYTRNIILKKIKESGREIKLNDSEKIIVQGQSSQPVDAKIARIKENTKFLSPTLRAEILAQLDRIAEEYKQRQTRQREKYKDYLNRLTENTSQVDLDTDEFPEETREKALDEILFKLELLQENTNEIKKIATYIDYLNGQNSSIEDTSIARKIKQIQSSIRKKSALTRIFITERIVASLEKAQNSYKQAGENIYHKQVDLTFITPYSILERELDYIASNIEVLEEYNDRINNLKYPEYKGKNTIQPYLKFIQDTLKEPSLENHVQDLKKEFTTIREKYIRELEKQIEEFTCSKERLAELMTELSNALSILLAKINERLKDFHLATYIKEHVEFPDNQETALSSLARINEEYDNEIKKMVEDSILPEEDKAKINLILKDVLKKYQADIQKAGSLEEKKKIQEEIKAILLNVKVNIQQAEETYRQSHGTAPKV